MDDYFHTNFTRCQNQYGFFDSFLFVQISSHSVLIFTLPSHVFGFYCIVYRTPERMRSIKWYLFNLQFWSFTVDFFYTTLITPVFFFPALASCSIGLLSLTHTPPIRIFQLGLIGYGGLTSATVMIFDYRNHSLSTAHSTSDVQRRAIRVVWHGSNFCICFLVGWALEASLDDVETGRLGYLEINPCPIVEYFTTCNFVLSRTNNYFTQCSLIWLSYISIQTMVLASHSFFKIYMIKSSLVSNATRRLQKSLFVGTCIQVMVPLCILILPMGYCYYAIFYEYYNQSALNFTGFLISFHGLVATIMMILVNSAYRGFTKSLVLNWIDPTRKVTTTVSVFMPRASRINASMFYFLFSHFCF